MLGLATTNLYTRFKIPALTHYKDMNGDEKCKKFGWFEGLGVTQGHQQHNHLIEHIRLSIRWSWSLHSTVGKLFTPTVPSGAESQLNQVTPDIAGTSVTSGQFVYLRWLRSTQPFILKWWINWVPARVRAANAASARWQITLCDPIWCAGSHSSAVLLAQLLYCFTFTFTRNC